MEVFSNYTRLSVPAPYGISILWNCELLLLIAFIICCDEGFDDGSDRIIIVSFHREFVPEENNLLSIERADLDIKIDVWQEL